MCSCMLCRPIGISWCIDKQDITFVLIEIETMNKLRLDLNKRFEVAETVPGTRSFHHYIPLSENTIGFKRPVKTRNYKVLIC